MAPAPCVVLCAKVEAELSELDDDEALELLQSFGQDESGLAQLSRVGFATLGLQTFLTAGPKEARAWTIHQGATAPEAAGRDPHRLPEALHQGRGRLLRRPHRRRHVAAVRAAGKARIEGKEYVMRDGDVVEFRVGV